MNKFGFGEILVLVVMTMFMVLGLAGAVLTGQGVALGLAGAGILLSGFFYAACKGMP